MNSSTRCLIAIKKHRDIEEQQSIPDPKTLEEYDRWKNRLAEKYVRENFVVWHEAAYDGGFRSEGVAIWEFLYKFENEWRAKKRREYVSSLDLIQEASSEVKNKSREWRKSLYGKSIFTKPMEERMKIPKFSEYMSCQHDCGSMIFDLIEANKGNVMTSGFAAPDWPFDLRYCEYGYIVDFDAGEFHVMKCIDPPTSKSSPRLRMLESIFKKQAISLIKNFDFSELPETRDEFLESLRTAENDLIRQPNAR